MLSLVSYANVDKVSNAVGHLDTHVTMLYFQNYVRLNEGRIVNF